MLKMEQNSMSQVVSQLKEIDKFFVNGFLDIQNDFVKFKEELEEKKKVLKLYKETNDVSVLKPYLDEFKKPEKRGRKKKTTMIPEETLQEVVEDSRPRRKAFHNASAVIKTQSNVTLTTKLRQPSLDASKKVKGEKLDEVLEANAEDAENVPPGKGKRNTKKNVVKVEKKSVGGQAEDRMSDVIFNAPHLSIIELSSESDGEEVFSEKELSVKTKKVGKKQKEVDGDSQEEEVDSVKSKSRGLKEMNEEPVKVSKSRNKESNVDKGVLEEETERNSTRNSAVKKNAEQKVAGNKSKETGRNSQNDKENCSRMTRSKKSLDKQENLRQKEKIDETIGDDKFFMKTTVKLEKLNILQSVVNNGRDDLNEAVDIVDETLNGIRRFSKRISEKQVNQTRIVESLTETGVVGNNFNETNVVKSNMNETRVINKSQPRVNETQVIEKGNFNETRVIEKANFNETRVVDKPNFNETRVIDKPNFNETRVIEKPNFNETRVIDKPNLNETRVIEKPNFNETRVIEKPNMNETQVIVKSKNKKESATSGVVSKRKSSSEISEEEEVDVRSKKKKEIFNPYDKTPVKQKIAAYEKIAKVASQTPASTRTMKTRIQNKENGDVQKKAKKDSTQYNTYIPVKDKCGTPYKSPLATNRYLPSAMSSSKLKKYGSFEQLSTTKTNSATKSSQHDFLDREQRRKNKEEEAVKKKEAILKTQMEEKRKKREEKEQKVRQQREALEKDVHKLAETRKKKEEKAKLLLAQKQEQLIKQKEESERRRKLVKQKYEERKREEERLLEEEMALKKKEEEAERMKRAKENMKLEEARLKQQGISKKCASKHQETPIYLRAKAPRLPTYDCYDSDEEKPENGDILRPYWTKSVNMHQQLKLMNFIDSKLKNTLFRPKAQTPDLTEIFQNIDPRRLRRNSSAVWNNSPNFTIMEFNEDD